MSMRVLLAILNSSELNSLANNAKIRSSLKFLLIRYLVHCYSCYTCTDLTIHKKTAVLDIAHQKAQVSSPEFKLQTQITNNTTDRRVTESV